MQRYVHIIIACAASIALVGAFNALSAQITNNEASTNGTVAIDSLSVPLSSLLSTEAHDYMVHLLRDRPFENGPNESDVAALRAWQDQIMLGFLKPIREKYAVNIEHKMIAGLYTDVVTPKDGIAPKNRNRVLINVHGGGFVTGARTVGLIESIPIAAIEKITVITIDYRMSPEYKFPAASEDVAVVYKELLKTYTPQHIGLYGCSAGGMLSGMSVAWFQKYKLPNPAAIGMLCASLGDMFSGDSGCLALSLNGMKVPPGNNNKSKTDVPAGLSYLRGADVKDPLVYPINSSEVLAKFPPTLFITSTRAFECSSAINSHNALVKAGVDTELHVWDGLPHAFWYNSELPESREAYDVIARFFDRHLGK